jgi:hypothetical protein
MPHAECAKSLRRWLESLGRRVQKAPDEGGRKPQVEGAEASDGEGANAFGTGGESLRDRRDESLRDRGGESLRQREAKGSCGEGESHRRREAKLRRRRRKPQAEWFDSLSREESKKRPAEAGPSWVR